MNWLFLGTVRLLVILLNLQRSKYCLTLKHVVNVKHVANALTKVKPLRPKCHKRQ